MTDEASGRGLKFKMDENRIGSLYIDGNMFVPVKDVDFDSVTYDPDENTSKYAGIRKIEPQEITIEITCNVKRFRRMFARLMGCKNFDKPRKRTKAKAIKRMYWSISFMSEERLRRLRKRFQKKLRRQRRMVERGTNDKD